MGDEVLFARDDELLSDLRRELDSSSAEEVRIWALEMIRKPLCYLKGRYSTVFGLSEFMDGDFDIDRKTAETVWKKLLRSSAETEDTADRLTLEAAAAFLRAMWEKDRAIDAMAALLTSIIYQDGPEDGIRGVPIVVFAAEEVLQSIKKKIA